MPAESIITYKKPGFPKFANSEKSYQTTIEYVGPQATLEPARPGVNAAWGDYIGIVTSTQLNPVEGTTQAELTVNVEYNYDNASGGTGTAREVTFEVEWVSFPRPMLEHPSFRSGSGGSNALTGEDIGAIEKWKESNVGTRAAYSYYDAETDTSIPLSANAKKFCQGIELGLESYEDYAPVIRKTTTFVGGLPGSSSAGAKDAPPNFSGRPAGYEWRKSADRAIKASGQTRWEKVEEWIGANKVLVDKNSIYF